MKIIVYKKQEAKKNKQLYSRAVNLSSKKGKNVVRNFLEPFKKLLKLSGSF